MPIEVLKYTVLADGTVGRRDIRAALDPALSDLGGKHLPEVIPRISDCLVADVDARPMRQIIDISERPGKSVLQNHRQTDDLRTGSKPLDRPGLVM